jgi:hypothetical protein
MASTFFMLRVYPQGEGVILEFHLLCFEIAMHAKGTRAMVGIKFEFAFCFELGFLLMQVITV